MERSLNVYKEGDKIVIEDDLTNIELPYTPELWWKLDGEKTYDEDIGWLIDGIELDTIIEEESDQEMENVFIGTIEVDGVDERRELYIVEEGDVYKIVGIDADQEELIDTEVISESLREAVLKSREIWGNDESDLRLSDEADEILKKFGE